METSFEESWERPMLQFLEKKTTRQNNRSEEMENEEIQGTVDERLKAMFIKSSKRRNAICKVKMPHEYFDALPYLELLNTLSNSGLT